MSETITDSARRHHKAREAERATVIDPMHWRPIDRLRYALSAECGVEAYDPTAALTDAPLPHEALAQISATLLDRSVEACRIAGLGTTRPDSKGPLVEDLSALVDAERPAENKLSEPLLKRLCEHRGLDVAAILDGQLPATLPGDRLDTEGDR